MHKKTDILGFQKSAPSRPFSVPFCDLIAIRSHFSINSTTDTAEPNSSLCQTTNTLGTFNHLLYLGYKQFEHIRHPSSVQFIYQKYGRLETACCRILHSFLFYLKKLTLKLKQINQKLILHKIILKNYFRKNFWSILNKIILKTILEKTFSLSTKK